MQATLKIKMFALFFFINLLTHSPFLNLAPCGSHVWRQCNTLAMAKNFAFEGMNIFEPKIDRRNESNGITGSHFPLYEWGLALLGGKSEHFELIARLYSILISSLTMFAFMILLIKIHIESKYAIFGAILFLSIPQFYYDSINAMPDIMALMFALSALCFLHDFYKKNNTNFIIPAVLACICAGLIKFQFLAIPLVAIVWIQRKRDHILFTGIASALVIGVVVKWYLYALELTKQSNLKEFGLWIKPINKNELLKTLETNLLSDLPELLSGWPIFITLILLSLLKIKQIEWNASTKLILVWFLGFIGFYAVAIERMHHHSYYFMMLLPLVIIVLMYLVQAVKLQIGLLVLLCIFNFTWAFVRIIPSRWTKEKMGIPIEFIDKNQRQAIVNSTSKNILTAIGPDISGCIYFYFTETKGYSFEKADELLEIKNGKPYIEQMREAGCKQLIIRKDSATNEVVRKIENKILIKTQGEFEVWQLN